MKANIKLLITLLLLGACQAPPPTKSDLPGSSIADQTSLVAQQATLNQPDLGRTAVLPSSMDWKNGTLTVHLQLPPLANFRTQALDLASAAKVTATVKDSDNLTYTPDGADGSGQIAYPAGGNLTLTFNNIVPDDLLLVELQVTDGTSNILQADLASIIANTGTSDSNFEISFRTTPAAKAMKALMAANATRARAIDLTALTTFVDTITGATGTYPGYTYTTHPGLVNHTQLALDLETQDPGVLTAATYRFNGATVNATVSGLIGTDQVNLQVTDSSSAINNNLSNGLNSIPSANPTGSSLVLKATSAGTPGTNYTYTVSPATLTLTEGGTQAVTVTATPASPAISSLGTANGTIGSSLTINGSNFHPSLGGNTVRFGSTTATVTAATATSLTVTVPAGISGTQNVTVQVGSQTNAGTNNYAVIPAITSFTPTSVPLGGSFTINGNGFDTTAGNNTISIGGTAATVTGATNTVLTVTMPTKIAGAYATTVQVGSQTSTSSNMTALSTITTFAGDGTESFGGDNGVPTSAQLSRPWGVSVNSFNHVVISDTFNNRIRIVPATTGTLFGRALTANTIYTLAGDGTPAFSGDNGPASAAQLNSPRTLHISNGNNISFVDTTNDRVRAIPHGSGTLYNLSVTSGEIYTIGGFGDRADSTDNVGRFAPAATFRVAEGLSLDANGAVFADKDNHVIRFISYLGSGTVFGRSVVANNIYYIAGAGFGGQTLNAPSGVYTNAARDIYVADSGNHRILFAPNTSGTYFGQAMTAHTLYVIAGSTGVSGSSGDGGPATSALLNTPKGIYQTANGVYIADTVNDRVRFIPLASGTFYGQTMTANNIYNLAGTGTTGYNSDGIHATTAHLNNPTGISVSSTGTVYIADRLNNRIRSVSP